MKKGFKTMKMKLSDIKITSAFAESVPSEKKMEKCRYNWNTLGIQDRYLVVNHGGYLIDGYVLYLVLKENNIEEVDVKISYKRKECWNRKTVHRWKPAKYKIEPTTYIYGSHLHGSNLKTYVWRVPKSWGDWASNLQVGDTITCDTKYGHAPIIVSKILISDTCPVDFSVKKVSNKKIKKYGLWQNTKEGVGDGVQ